MFKKKWKPSKSKAREFAMKMDKVTEFCNENNTPYPDRLNPDIYDVVKAYPILKPKPIPKYITKFTALRILNKIIDNVVSNKL